MNYNLGDKNRPSTPHNDPHGAGYPSKNPGKPSGGHRGNNNPRR